MLKYCIAMFFHSMGLSIMRYFRGSSSSLIITVFFMMLCGIALNTFSHQAYAEQSNNKIMINGSTTVYSFVFDQHLNDIQKDVGFEFNAFPSSSGRGVMALVDGTADIAMISSNFVPLVTKLNDKQETHINIDDYKTYDINTTKVLFTVHPDNPITTLSKQQIKQLFTGEINHWGALGFDHLGPVKVVTEHPTGGIYNTVLSQVTDGEDITDDKIIMQNGPQTAVVVSQLPGGFGMLSAATPKEQRLKVSVINTGDFEAIQYMNFVTKKNEDRKNVLHIINTIKDKFAE